MNETRRTLIAAAAIFLGFVLFAYFLPVLMTAAMDISPWAAGAVGIVFIFAFFAVFWLRGRNRQGK